MDRDRVAHVHAVGRLAHPARTHVHHVLGRSHFRSLRIHELADILPGVHLDVRAQDLGKLGEDSGERTHQRQTRRTIDLGRGAFFENVHGPGVREISQG